MQQQQLQQTHCYVDWIDHNIRATDNRVAAANCRNEETLKING